MTELSNFDKALLNALQRNIPICSRPFASLAQQLNSDEQTVISRLRELKAAGFLRRIGTFFDSSKLGYRGVLVALAVDSPFLEHVALYINRYSGATHNYEREGSFNLWFTLLSPSFEQQQSILSEIRALHGVRDMLCLSSKKKYKVDVHFSL